MNDATGAPGARRRAAVYARFSTELQKDRSVEDQVALCRQFAQREGMIVVDAYDDRARSGASTFGRDGLARLMDDARAGRFDVVIVEALDRLSRDQEDLAGIWKRLRFLGIELVAVHDGVADAVQIGVRGLLGGLFLADLAHKVRRGMTGVVRDGRHAGGKAYGYRPTPGRPGEMIVEGDEAAIVLRIFTEYAAGASPRDIAHGLNRDRVPPPRGTRWNASTINGSKQRGTGILGNELYGGRLIWNRVRMIRDPATGKRVSRPNPEAEWQTADVPHLRIVPADLLEQVRSRVEGRSRMSPNLQQRAKHLLSGLLRCGRCGGGMSSLGRDKGRVRIVCSTHRESGSCDNGRRYYLDEIERTVLGGLRAELTSPAALTRYVRAYRDEMSRLTATARRDRSRAEARLAEVDRELKRGVRLLLEGKVPAEAVGEELKALEREKADLSALIAQADQDAPVVTLHPQAVERYRADIEALDAALPSAVATGAADALRSLVERVVVQPTPVGTPVEVEIVGRLSLLIGHDVFPSRRIAGGPMVAEARFNQAPRLNSLQFSIPRRFEGSAA